MVILDMNLGTRSPSISLRAATDPLIFPTIRAVSGLLAAVDWSGCLAAKDLV